MSRKALVLISGGIDSAVIASMLSEKNYKMHFLHFSYSQDTALKELELCRKLSKHFKAQKTIVMNLGFMCQTESAIITRKNPYVPGRNTVFLAAAATYAEKNAIKEIYIGAIRNDGAGFPDCRPDFIRSFNKMLKISTGGKVTLKAPLVSMKKHEVIRLGIKLKTPFELTWSCYFKSKRPCGTCLSCLQRHKAFLRAGIRDPLIM